MGMFTLAFFANCCPWTAVRAMWTFRLIDRDICQNTESRHSWARTCRTRLRQMRHRSNARDTTQLPHTNSNTTHTHLFNGPLSRTTRVSRYQKGKPIWILLKQETVSGSGISWAICKSAPRSRQITMKAPHHSVFHRPDALSAAQPTASKHWRQTRDQDIKSRLRWYWDVVK